MRDKAAFLAHVVLTLGWASVPWLLWWLGSEVSSLSRLDSAAQAGVMTMLLWTGGVLFFSEYTWRRRTLEQGFWGVEAFRPFLKEGQTPFERFTQEHDDLQSLLRLYHQLLLEKEALATKLEQAKKTGLDPEMGFLLDGATKGELAAYDYAVASHCAAVLDILDGKDTGAGACNEPWASVRLRLLNLVSIAEAVPEGGTAADLRNLRRANDKMATGVQHLRELVGVMSNCYISSWQTVHWHSELEKAQAFLKELDDV